MASSHFFYESFSHKLKRSGKEFLLFYNEIFIYLFILRIKSGLVLVYKMLLKEFRIAFFFYLGVSFTYLSYSLRTLCFADKLMAYELMYSKLPIAFS